MNITDKEQAIKRYEERLARFGKSAKTVGWRDENQQELRFKILTEIFDLEQKKILDVGCGFGDLYTYLSKKGTNVSYTGYDISAKLLEVAKQNNPGMKFTITDILINPVTDKFDYVFSSGLFNHKVSDNLSFAKKMIKKMYEIATTGIAFNMMTNYVDYHEDKLYYYSPEEMFSFSQDLSRHLTLRHDYPLYEFTIYIFKRN